MHLPEFNTKGERMVLTHGSRPGFRGLFWIVLLAALAYLAVILSAAPMPGAGH
jgi:hypothetical protein